MAKEENVRFAQILRSIWRDTDWTALTVNAQWMYKALLSQESINAAGIVPLTVRRWLRLAVDVTRDLIEAALAELEKARFVLVDWDTEEVLIRTFIRNDGLWIKPTMMRKALGMAREVQSEALKLTLGEELQKLVPVVLNGKASGVPPVVFKELSEQTDDTANVLLSVGAGPRETLGNPRSTLGETYPGVGGGAVTYLSTAPTPTTTPPPTPAPIEVANIPATQKPRAGRGIARLNDTSGSIEAHALVAEYGRRSGGLPGNLEGEIRGVVHQLLTRGMDRNQVLAGLEAWQASDRLYPSTIPNFVHKAGAKTKGISTPSKAAMGARDIAEELIRLNNQETAL